MNTYTIKQNLCLKCLSRECGCGPWLIHKNDKHYLAIKDRSKAEFIVDALNYYEYLTKDEDGEWLSVVDMMDSILNK